MKKRVLAGMMAAAMCLSLAACGGSSAKPETSAATEAATAGETAAAQTEAAAEKSDLDYIKEKGTLVVGITDFAPMDYKNEAGEWIGFDADMAKAFAAELGVEVEFIEIDWDNKIPELENYSIDCVWNGMTINDEVKGGMEVSNPYCKNAQVIVTKTENLETFKDAESIKAASVAVEAGSAGKSEAEAAGCENIVEVKAQADALMEVSSGLEDVAIIDLLMAVAMTGEGTGYSDLGYTAELNAEEYGVGFRKGSDAAAALNDFFKKAYGDGTMTGIADTYEVFVIEQ